MVRDPRNVFTSLSHHFTMNIEESYNFITDKGRILTKSEWGTDDFGIATVLGSWSEHYKSWKKIKFAPILIVKYEDLIQNTKESLIRIINFLCELIDIKIDEKRILNAANSCTFEKLAEKEKTEGFIESVFSKKNNEKLKFFYLGEKNNWRNLLNPVIEKKIRTSFNAEMRELNYA